MSAFATTEHPSKRVFSVIGISVELCSPFKTFLFDFEEAFDEVDNFEEFDFERYGVESLEGAGFLIVTNCDSWVSLRSEPSTKASRVAKVPLGADVEAYYFNDKFYWCVYEGQTGFILSKYLKP